MKILKALLIGLTFYSRLYSQTDTLSNPNATRKTRVVTQTKIFRYDSSSVIIDSNGHIIPYPEWDELMGTGNYVISPKQDSAGKEIHVLIKLNKTEKERIARFSPKESPNFPKGQELEFSGTDLNRMTYDNQVLKGKVVILHICKPIEKPQRELSPFNELVDSLGSGGDIVYIALAAEDRKNALKQLNGFTCRFILLTDQGELLRKYAIHEYPQDIIISKDGKIFYSTVGFGTSAGPWLRKKARAALAGYP